MGYTHSGTAGYTHSGVTKSLRKVKVALVVPDTYRHSTLERSNIILQPTCKSRSNFANSSDIRRLRNTHSDIRISNQAKQFTVWHISRVYKPDGYDKKEDKKVSSIGQQVGKLHVVIVDNTVSGVAANQPIGVVTIVHSSARKETGGGIALQHTHSAACTT